MTIHLVNEDIQFDVTVFYNFRQVTNCIILRFDKPLSGKRDFVLLYNPVTGKWLDLDALAENHPDIFAQVTNKLERIQLEGKKMLEGINTLTCNN
jgi:hypothetical protein